MIKEIFPALVVFIGAGIGGVLRYAVGRATATVSQHFPFSTLGVNVVGSLAMGLIAGWFAFRAGAGMQDLRLFLTTGVLGGFTTFSAFSLETALLWDRGATLEAGLYVVSSVACSLVAVFVGLGLVRLISH